MWYPPLDFVNYVDTQFLTDKISLEKKYIISLYNSVLMIGGNELGPVNEIEFLTLVVILLSASLINA
jgi:hypothetical protein